MRCLKTDDVKAMVAQTIAAFGPIGYAFNNAGIEGACSYKIAPRKTGTTIGVNLKGVWLCMKYEIPEILKQRKRSHRQLRFHC
jgi:NAD(P)-dependent dehydrogenase (short-subunit alcohol dehydrogenase family)